MLEAGIPEETFLRNIVSVYKVSVSGPPVQPGKP